MGVIKDTFDIFPDNQFPITGYQIVRHDRDRNDGGLL